MQRLKAEALFNIGNAYFVKGQYDHDFYTKSLDYFTKTKEFAKSIKYSLIEGKTHFSIGLIHYYKKNFDLALKSLLQDEVICKQEKDFNGLRATYENLGLVFQAKKLFSEAEECFKKSLRVIESHFPQDLIPRKEIKAKLQKLETDRLLHQKVCNDIKVFYRRNIWNYGQVVQLLTRLMQEAEEFEQAKTLFYSAMKKCEDSIKSSEVQNLNFFHIGANIERSLKNYSKAREHFKRIIDFYSKNPQNTEDYLYFLIDFGNFLDETKANPNEIEETYMKAHEVAKFLGDRENMKVALGNLESLYEDMNDKKNKERIRAKIKEMGSKMEEELDSDQDPESFSKASIESIDSEAKEEFIQENEDLEFFSEESPISKPDFDKIDKISKNFISRKAEIPAPIQPKTIEASSFYSKYCTEHMIWELDCLKSLLNQNNFFLANKNFGDELLRPLLKALPLWQKLVVLDLSYNQLTDKSLSRFFKAIKKIPEVVSNLRVLNLAYNPFLNENGIVDHVLQIVLENAEGLSSLDISGVHFSSSLFWKAFLNVHRLQELKCRECGLIDPEDWNTPIENNVISLIDVSSNLLSMKSMSWLIENLHSLKEVNFSYNKGEKTFSSQDNLIMKEGNHDLSQASFKNKNLRSLKLKGNQGKISPELMNHFGLLEKLDLSYNSEGDLQDALYALIDFFFREKTLGNDPRGNLRSFKIKGIRRDIGNQSQTFILCLLKVLIHQNSLEVLDISENGIEEQDILEIARHLPSNLRKIRLRANKISENHSKNILGYLNPHLGNRLEIEF